jgi:hypothetical protein
MRQDRAERIAQRLCDYAASATLRPQLVSSELGVGRWSIDLKTGKSFDDNGEHITIPFEKELSRQLQVQAEANRIPLVAIDMAVLTLDFLVAQPGTCTASVVLLVNNIQCKTEKTFSI